MLEKIYTKRVQILKISTENASVRQVEFFELPNALAPGNFGVGRSDSWLKSELIGYEVNSLTTDLGSMYGFAKGHSMQEL